LENHWIFVSLKDLVFIDETGVNLSLTCHARARKGKELPAVSQWGKHYLIGAIAMSGLLASFTLKDGQIKTRFTYVQEVLVPQLWSGACVVMDNLPAHKAKKFEKLLNQWELELNFISILLILIL